MKSNQEKPSVLKNIIKCSGQNQALHVCTNAQCKHTKLFTCGVRICGCRKNHLECTKADIDGILDKIDKKIGQSDKLKEYVEKVFDQLIDKMSAIRQELLISIEEDLKVVNLHKIEMHFLKIIQNQSNLQELTSQQTSFLWKNLCDKKQTNHKTFQQIHKIIQTYQQSCIQKVQVLKNRIEEIKKNLARQNNVLLKRENAMIQNIVKTSSIIKEYGNGSKLIKFFPKHISKIKLLYKASQNDFSVQKFYQLCGKETNTILLCLTDKNKIVGGYTPFHYFSGKKQWVVDEKNQSFMFSLTRDEKYSLIDSQKYCLYRYQTISSYIQLGYSQILISNKANKTHCCRIGNNDQKDACYFNPHSKLEDKQFYKALNGNQTCFCSLKQWQFWKVQFQNSESK